MALLKPKVPFWASHVPAETHIFVVFGDFVWSQKKYHFPKADSVNDKARFLPSEHK